MFKWIFIILSLFLNLENIFLLSQPPDWSGSGKCDRYGNNYCKRQCSRKKLKFCWCIVLSDLESTKNCKCVKPGKICPPYPWDEKN